MATIRQRKNKSWQGIIRRKGFPHQSRVFKLKSDVLKWVRSVEVSFDQGYQFNHSLVSKTLLSDLIDRYGKEISPQKRSYTRELSRLRIINESLGEYALINLTPQVVSQYRDKRLSEGKSGATVVKDINTLSHICEIAKKEWGYGAIENPTKFIRKPKVNRNRIRRLSETEEKILLNSAEKSQSVMLKNIIIFAIETGLRLGEIINLNWLDIDKNVATIRQTKNGIPRQIPLSKIAINSIQNLPKHISKNQIFWSWNSPSSFKSTWQRMIKNTQIQDLRFHDLRHEAISRLFEKGLNPMEVAAISGHQTLQVLKAYTHIKVSHLAHKLENINL
ncbi:site-specific integrase [Methylophilaceae bacterium]|nr:site-specific integrase [Methylophilaceae bacterium]